MAGFPDKLKRIGAAAKPIESRPKQQPTPPPAMEWAASGRTDGVTVKEGEAAERHYLDGPTQSEREGFEIQAQLEEAKLERHRAAQEAAKNAPQGLRPFTISRSMAEAMTAAQRER